MKQLIYNINITLSLFALSACSSSSPITPLNNDALTKVSDSNSKHKSGYMQRAYDEFIKTKWNPAMQESPEIQKKYDSKEDTFTLQEYVDKSIAYSKKHPSDENNSFVHKMESMPVIGK